MTLSRQEISELLPFLANDTLAGEERAEVQAAVDADPELASELAALRAIRATMKAEADSIRSPGEFGLARLMRDVEAEGQAVTAPTTARISRPVFWQVAAAVLLAVVLGQAWMIQRDPDAGIGYELAGAEDGIILAIEPTASEAELRGLLLDAGVEIVAGPSALGLYTLRPVEGVTLDEARAVLENAPIVQDLTMPSE